jgi:branched-chain amino acid transport system substrate-binding protein
MALRRRDLVLASAATIGVARPALAQQSEPIRLGWLAALTGPGSSAGIGFDRGLRFGVEEINAAGGVDGRRIEILARDTQGDPTKCVNAVQEMINRLRTHVIWGPVNSGESLAAAPILARARMPNLFPGVVDQLADPAKFPSAFRVAPSSSQWAEAAHRYCLGVLKLPEIAVVGDTTGYGTSAADASEAMLKRDGAKVVGKYLIEAQQTDVTADLTRMRNAGAKVILVWSVNGGLLSRIINTRSQMGWDVPVAGHPVLGSGEVKALLAKPENWEKVYAVGYRNCSFDTEGKLPPRTDEFVRKLQGKVALHDTSLWWLASAYDVAHMVANAVRATGGSTDSARLIAHWEGLGHWPGVFGTYSFSASNRNGFTGSEVVMQLANSNRDGAFTIAPGYS